jgi:hypothetical protein
MRSNREMELKSEMDNPKRFEGRGTAKRQLDVLGDEDGVEGSGQLGHFSQSVKRKEGP